MMQFAIEQVSNERIAEATTIETNSNSKDRTESHNTTEKSPAFSSKRMQSIMKSPEIYLEEPYEELCSMSFMVQKPDTSSTGLYFDSLVKDNNRFCNSPKLKKLNLIQSSTADSPKRIKMKTIK